MLKQALICLLFFILTIRNTLAQDVSVLIDQKKYETAFRLLEDQDPANNNPDLVIQKVDLAINYFVTSIMHKAFAFKDLLPGEDLMEIRGTQKKYNTYSFIVDSILLNLIDVYPENMELKKMLGVYYHDVHYRYGSQWFISEDSLVSLFKQYLLIAYNNGTYDDQSLYLIGYADLLKGNYLEAVKYFNESLRLNDLLGNCHYNLAYAYMALSEWESGLQHAHKAMELYEDRTWQGDAARLVAIAFEELGNLPKALEFYRLSNLLVPNNYHTLKPMLLLTSKIGDTNDLKMHSKDLFDLAPDNPTVYQDLMEVYYGLGAEKELVEFLDRQLIPYADQVVVKGNINFYKGVIYFDLKDKENSRENFENARRLFNEVYKNGHEVFPVIESYLNSL